MGAPELQLEATAVAAPHTVHMLAGSRSGQVHAVACTAAQCKTENQHLCQPTPGFLYVPAAQCKAMCVVQVHVQPGPLLMVFWQGSWRVSALLSQTYVCLPPQLPLAQFDFVLSAMIVRLSSLSQLTLV